MNEPAFPQQYQYTVHGEPIMEGAPGMTLRDYFAVRAPAPSRADVDMILRMEQQANPHNDSYKPRRRGVLEIECALRYKWADAMLAARGPQHDSSENK